MEGLVVGPDQLGLSYEFWYYLVRQYLVEPNLHTPTIARAIDAGLFGVNEEEIFRCMLLYWKVVLVAWRFEAAFVQACFDAGLPSYLSDGPLTELPHFGIRWAAPVPLRLGNLFRFDSPNREVEHIGPNPYIQSEAFRDWHVPDGCISLSGCRGISSCLLPGELRTEYQLKYIVEYGTACEPCQDAEDIRVSYYTAPGGERYHRPKFHPLFYTYPSRSTRSRPVRIENATYFNSAESWENQLENIERFEEDSPPIFFEVRPTAAEIISTLICVDQEIAPALAA